MRHVTPLAACLGIAVLTPFAAAQSSWQQQRPTTIPSVRYNAMAATMTDRIIMFGGTGPTSPETWQWIGGKWQLFPRRTSPPARSLGGMAYDPTRNKVVLFGGFETAMGRYLDDTWEWDGAKWTEIKATTKPVARCGQALAYDPVRKRVIMFGGYDGNSLRNDTWEWDGANWAAIRTSRPPAPRCCMGLATDTVRQRIVLFGGAKGIGTGEHADTWLYANGTWVQQQPRVSPPARRTFGMAFDTARSVTTLFGGGTATPRTQFGDTWDWDGSTWFNRGSTGPKKRTGPAMATDPTGGVLLFGGLPLNNALSDTWRFATDKLAKFEPLGSRCAQRTAPSLGVQPGKLPWTGMTFTVDMIGLPSAQPAAILVGASDQMWGSRKLPFDLGTIGMTGCNLYVSVDATFPLTATNGNASWNAPVPNLIWMAGQSFYVQTIAALPGANPLGAVMTNAGKATIGVR